MGVTTYGLPAMAALEDLIVAVVLASDNRLLWTFWALGGGHGPWTEIPLPGGHLTDVAPAVAITAFAETVDGGTLPVVWLAIRDVGDNRIYETQLQPDGTFGGWTLVPATRTDSSPNGWTTNVSPAASNGSLTMAPIMLALAAPPDDLTYVNANLGEQPPTTSPPAPDGYWQPIVPSLPATTAPALAVVDGGPAIDGGYYMFVLVTAGLIGPLHLELAQGDSRDPSNLAAPWENMGFETNIAPAMASLNNRTVAVAVDTDGAMSYNWWDLGGGAQGWTGLNAPGDEVTTSVAPAVALADEGRYMFVLAQGSDGEMQLYQGNVGGTRVGWQPAETPGNQ